MHVVIFEDSRWHGFAPFSLSRPVFSLLSGMTTLLQKQIRHLRPSRLTLWVRPELESYCRERIAPTTGIPTLVNIPLDDQPAVLVNGRCGFSAPFDASSQQFAVIGDGQTLIAACTMQPGLTAADALQHSDQWNALFKLPTRSARVRLLESAVDIIYWNNDSLVEDFAHLERQASAKPAGPFHLVNEMDIWLGRDVSLSPGCVLDASKGPIAIAEGASIGSNAVIQGPCWIGPGSIITPLATIRAGTSIGPVCKVGGEVSVSIFLGCSNKSHDGFMGQSYVGKWVNLGAGTTTSNLKNTYGPITLKRGSKEIPTERRFLGTLIGDHSRTAIHTRLMAGTYLGFFTMLAGSKIAPRFLPSFTFWTDKGTEPYLREKAVEVAQRVFTRRDRVWTETDEQIMNYAAEAARQVES